MKDILLNWVGPIDFKEIKNSNYTNSFEGISNGGIYIHCYKLPKDEKYAIAYVGKHEYSILNRNIEHYKNTESGKYSLYSLLEETFLDIIYNQNNISNKETFINDIRQNLSTLKLFYVSCDAKEIYDYATLKPLEGAIQFHLYSKTITRKYLLTNVSNYDLKNTRIINDKSKLTSSFEIVGLDDVIQTFLDPFAKLTS